MGISSRHRIAGITTPESRTNGKQKLRRHPDQDFAEYALRGIEHNFQRVTDRAKQFIPTKRKMQSAIQNPDIVENYLHTEVTKGNILGPFRLAVFPSVHILTDLESHGTPNRLVPKHQLGKWRLIKDLSYAEGKSVSDFCELYSGSANQY